MTAKYLPRIGARADEAAAFERAASNGDELIVHYRINTYTGRGALDGEGVASGIAKWSRVNLREATWVPLTPEQAFKGARTLALVIEDGPPPRSEGGYTAVPILIFPHSLRGSSELIPHLVAQAEPYPLSLHHSMMSVDWQIPSSPILVRRDGDNKMHAASLGLPKRDSNAWWAIPARIGAAPFMLIADMLLTPFYVACMFSCSM